MDEEKEEKEEKETTTERYTRNAVSLLSPMTRVFLLLLLLRFFYLPIHRCSVIESQRQLSWPQVSWQHPIHQEFGCLIYRSPGNCCGSSVLLNALFSTEGNWMHETRKKPVCMYLFYYLQRHLHWMARAANSAANSVVTGRRPCRMSFLICRKNWYLQKTKESENESTAASKTTNSTHFLLQQSCNKS